MTHAPLAATRMKWVGQTRRQGPRYAKVFPGCSIDEADIVCDPCYQEMAIERRSPSLPNTHELARIFQPDNPLSRNAFNENR